MLRPCLGTSLAALLVATGCAGSGEIITGKAGHGGTSSAGTNGTGSAGTGSAGTNGTGSAGTTGTGGTTGGAGVTGGAGTSGTGSAGTTGAGGTSGIMPPPSAIPTANACSSNLPGPRRVRRLAASEFAASIRTIFNDTAGTAPVSNVFSDPVVLGFSVDANSLLVQGLAAGQLMDNAEAIAAWAAANNKLTAFATCTTVDATCAKTFVKALGRKAFRATLADSDARIATYTKIFMAETSFSNAAQAVISAMLQSPYFLYRSELGTQGTSDFALTPFEVASALAYLLTGNMPDDTLLSAADNATAGSLTVAAMIDQQAARLLATSSASNATAIMGFMNGWLGLDRLYTTAKDDSVYMLSDAMRDNMAAETKALVLEAFNGSGSFGSLLTANHTFLNKDLATFYGLPTTGLSTTFSSVALASGAAREPGLLAQGTILNGYARPDTSSPTQRGHLVRTRILCQDVPPPPPNLDTTFKPSAGAKTTRQHFEDEHSVGVCYTCHRLMDDIGFGFEHYDGFGRHRDSENGVAVDASGTIIAASASSSPTFNGLSGAGSLGEYLAGSDDVKQCMIRHWAYYSYGSSSWAQDACTYNAIYQEASSGGFALKNVLMGIIHAPNFTRRVQDQ